MNVLIIGHTLAAVKPPSPAAYLSPGERRDLALKVLAGTEPVKCLAQQNDVSRKFLYAQARKAEQALEEAFDPTLREANSRVLFYIPVTKEWLCQVVLALILICHSSIRAVCEFFATLFDSRISVGTVHNILHHAAVAARTINAREDLSGIRAGAHDEIFQAGHPVLTGADAASTYCYLLALAEGRDADTWGVHLLDLAERGLNPDYTIADGGQALRAAQAEAWPGVPCRGDVFHPLRDMGCLAFYLKNRAKRAVSYVAEIDQEIIQTWKRCRKDPSELYKKAAQAPRMAKEAVDLAEAVDTLYAWLREDILSLVGPDFRTRQELFDFVVEELKKRETLASHRIRPIRLSLERHRDALLAFARALDEKLEEIARAFGIDVTSVRGVCELNGRADDATKSQKAAQLRRDLRSAFDPVQDAVQDALDTTIRASSIIENLNSRLRNYFFLRRHLNQHYLDLLRFFLNHRRFLRSEHPERAGKSPIEILTGRRHPHWLEDLGFKRFRRVA